MRSFFSFGVFLENWNLLQTVNVFSFLRILGYLVLTSDSNLNLWDTFIEKMRKEDPIAKIVFLFHYNLTVE